MIMITTKHYYQVHVYMYAVCMYVMYVRMYVCMYVCMHVCIYAA